MIALTLAGPAHPVLYLEATYRQLLKILYTLVGGPPKHQNFPGSYTDLPHLSTKIWSIQVALA